MGTEKKQCVTETSSAEVKERKEAMWYIKKHCGMEKTVRNRKKHCKTERSRVEQKETVWKSNKYCGRERCIVKWKSRVEEKEEMSE